MQRPVYDWGGNIVALAVVITVNWMANALPIAGITTGAVSDKYPSLFTPAGFTFAIWGLIYLLLTVFIVYQALPAQRANAVLARIGTPFKASCAANSLWIFAWHLEWLAVTLLLMFALLAALVIVYRSLADAPLVVQAPFSVYLAWISVATIANLSALETALGLTDWSIDTEITWTTLKIAVAGAVAAIVGLHRDDFLFLLTVAWAAFGIAEGQLLLAPVAGAATALSYLSVLLAAFVLLRRGWAR